jgi:hypothetical protein
VNKYTALFAGFTLTFIAYIIDIANPEKLSLLIETLSSNIDLIILVVGLMFVIGLEEIQLRLRLENKHTPVSKNSTSPPFIVGL